MTEKRQQVINTLEKLAFLGELAGENPFKLRAYANAARIIGKLEGDFNDLYHSGEIKKQKGIGSGIFAIIKDVMDGKPNYSLTDLESQVPPELLSLAKIHGLGPKRIRTLWIELGVTSIAELEYAIKENRLKSLKGFGDKFQDTITRSLSELKQYREFLRLDQALTEAARFIQTLKATTGVERVEIVGQLRRRQEIIKSIDLLLLVSQDHFHTIRHPRVGRDPGELQTPWFPAFAGMTDFINIHICTDKNLFGAQQFILSSSQYFLDKIGTDVSQIPSETEDGIFEALGLWPTPPELRETGEYIIKKGTPTPKLVTRSDLQGAFHNHTIASDGINTLAQMRQAAIDRGLRYISINDHSQTAIYANGLQHDLLLNQINEISNMNNDEEANKCHLFSGIESDILATGALDYDKSTLEKLDVVIASVHSRLKQDEEQMTHRMIEAASNPHTTIIGHPTGRLLLGRKPSIFNMELFLDACAKSGCAVELNANPARLDLHETHLAMAKERKILISINADAHAAKEFDDLEFGVMIARRAGLTIYDVLNCRPLEDIKTWLIS